MNKKKFTHIAALALTGGALTLTAACGSNSSSTNNSHSQGKSGSSSTQRQNSQTRQFGGVSGLIKSVSGSAATVTTNGATQTVPWDSHTAFTLRKTGTLSDLKVGDEVTVTTGTSNDTATSISSGSGRTLGVPSNGKGGSQTRGGFGTGIMPSESASSQGANGGFGGDSSDDTGQDGAPTGGFSGGASGGGPSTSDPRSNNDDRRNFVSGTVTKVGKDSITIEVKNQNSSVTQTQTFKVTGSTTITITSNASASDVKPGLCLTSFNGMMYSKNGNSSLSSTSAPSAPTTSSSSSAAESITLSDTVNGVCSAEFTGGRNPQ